MPERAEGRCRDVIVDRDFADGDLICISGIDGRTHLAYDYAGRTGSLWRVVGDTNAGQPATVIAFGEPHTELVTRYVYLITAPEPCAVALSVFSTLANAKVSCEVAVQGGVWEQLDGDTWSFKDSSTGHMLACVVRRELLP